MRLFSAVLSGLIGATTLTVLNEAARRVVPHAPRIEVLGMRAVSRVVRGVDQPAPDYDRLFQWALAGDLISNTAYYSLVSLGRPQRPWLRALLLGLGAGVGAVVVPRPAGLGTQPRARFPITQLLTVAWYLIGALATAAAARRLIGPAQR